MSLIKAVFYGPFAIASFLLTLIMLLSGFNSVISPMLALGLIIFMISLAGNIIIGIPTHLVLKKLNVKNGFAYILIGFISPTLILGVVEFFGNQSYRSVLTTGLIFGCFGAFCAYVFWLCVVYESSADAIVDPLLNTYSATGINFAQPLSAQAQQASKIYPSSA